MSAVTTVDIYCDGIQGDGTRCSESVTGYPGTPRAARTNAHRAGWRRYRRPGTWAPDDMADLCPTCARFPHAATLTPHTTRHPR